MTQFASRQSATDEDDTADGNTFLEKCKDSLHDLFDEAVANFADDMSVEEFVDELSDTTWKKVDRMLRESYHNGIAGSKRKRRPRRR